MQSPGDSQQFNTPKRPRGRPKGHKMSAASKLQISTTRLDTEARKKAERVAALPSDDDLMTELERAEATSRDRSRCAGCGDQDLTLRVMRWGNGDLNVMCSFCRQAATDIGASSLHRFLNIL